MFQKMYVSKCFINKSDQLSVTKTKLQIPTLATTFILMWSTISNRAFNESVILLTGKPYLVIKMRVRQRITAE